MSSSAPKELRQARDRRAFMWFAVPFAVLAFAGFARTYYLKPLFHGPALPLLIHLHGVVMTAWVVFFSFRYVLSLPEKSAFIVALD